MDRPANDAVALQCGGLLDADVQRALIDKA